jgi:hypothetical protein
MRAYEADTKSGTRGTSSDDYSASLLDQSINKAHDTDRQVVSKSIIEILRICFECLWDPVQSRKTRQLLLQNYQTANRLLRTALSLDSRDSSLAEPIRLLALYEVGCLFSQACRTCG